MPSGTPSHRPAAGTITVDPTRFSSRPSVASRPAPQAPDGFIKDEVKDFHITELPITWKNWYKHVSWLNVILIVGFPVAGLVSAFWSPLHSKTAVFAVTYYFATALGITAGYHRLWAHTSYTASLPLKIFLAAVGGGAVEGSIRWWARDHRAHHRYTDTDKDPYSVNKGLIYSHFGWMLIKQNPKRIGRTDITDRNSPRNHFITALITLGEGYHNFHHEFPSDYRNAIEWHQYDPTKWSIWIWKQVGLAYDLKQFRSNEIEKGRLQQLQKKLDQKRDKIDWGIPLEQLPVMEWDDYESEVYNGRGLIAIAGIVHDATDFINDHPGGKAMIKSGLSRDATAIFNGGVYNHSNAAHNLLSTMRVGVIRGGMEVEVWKQANTANGDIAVGEKWQSIDVASAVVTDSAA